MKKIVKVLGGGLLVLASLSQVQVAFAEDKNAKLEAIKKKMSAKLSEAKPNMEVIEIQETPIAGLYKASIGEGSPDLYMSENGEYFIAGQLYQVQPGKFVNLTDQEKNGDRAKAMASIDKKDMIVFAPEEKAKKAIYVFTDVDCGYCQLLHNKVPEYNKLGIEIRYLAYPRAGIPSGSYNKIASAWCAKDRQDALTKLKSRENIPENVCEGNPVINQYQVGRSIGLTGTPALITEDGELIAGYVEPEKLAEMLQL